MRHMGENRPFRFYPGNPFEGEIEMGVGAVLIEADAIDDPQFNAFEGFE